MLDISDPVGECSHDKGWPLPRASVVEWAHSQTAQAHACIDRKQFIARRFRRRVNVPRRHGYRLVELCVMLPLRAVDQPRPDVYQPAIGGFGKHRFRQNPNAIDVDPPRQLRIRGRDRRRRHPREIEQLSFFDKNHL